MIPYDFILLHTNFFAFEKVYTKSRYHKFMVSPQVYTKNAQYRTNHAEGLVELQEEKKKVRKECLRGWRR